MCAWTIGAHEASKSLADNSKTKWQAKEGKRKKLIFDQETKRKWQKQPKNDKNADTFDKFWLIPVCSHGILHDHILFLLPKLDERILKIENIVPAF